MRLVPEAEFTTQLCLPADEQQLAQSRLIVRAKPLAQTLTGAVLEACIEVLDSYLVFMSDDIPSEDSLHIYRLDAHFSLQESLTIGAAYCTGAFVLRELVAPAQVVFSFLGGGIWRLNLTPTPQMHMPLLSDPKAVSRPFGLSTRLKVQFELP